MIRIAKLMKARDAWDKEGEGCWNFYAFSSQISIFKITHPSIWTQDIVLFGFLRRLDLVGMAMI